MTTIDVPHKPIRLMTEREKQDHFCGKGKATIAEVYFDNRLSRFCRTGRKLAENGATALPGETPLDNRWAAGPDPVAFPVDSLKASRLYWEQVRLRQQYACERIQSSVEYGTAPFKWEEWLMGPALVDERGNYVDGRTALRIVGDRLREAREHLAKIDAELAEIDAARRVHNNIRVAPPVNIVMSDFDVPR